MQNSDGFLNIVLYQPEIPQNTGNIARMCAANKLKLHLIEPLGFVLSDKHLKRAALDYWEFLDYEIYPSWDKFIEVARGNLWMFSTKVTKSYWDAGYQRGDYLVFGPETRGLPAELLAKYADTSVTIPMRSENVRSLNLASTVQTAYYEAFRVCELAFKG